MTSSIVSAMPQVDGRIAVQERHVRATGETMDVFYLAEADADIAAILAERAAQLEDTWPSGM